VRALLLTAAVLSLVACGGTAAGQRAAPSPPARAASPTATPINVDDMMGLVPQQTVFVATTEHVAAVTLLNHFTRYRVATNGVAQVGADGAGRWLFVLDVEAPGSHRLRAFGVSSGAELAGRAGIAGVAAEGRGALSAAVPGRVLVLKSDARRAWVDAYDAPTLRPLGTVTDAPMCGDRLLASASRIAVVCLSTGQIVVDDLRGNRAAVDGAPPDLVAAAMADDGALYVATADRRLAAAAGGATKLANMPWPSEWSGTVLADGLAVARGGASVVVAERTDDGAWLRVFGTDGMAQRKSLRLDGAPRGGVLALWPFAYYTVDRSVRHVDLNSGLLETMTEVGAGAVPGAVVNG
jgi:hypothetical protein